MTIRLQHTGPDPRGDRAGRVAATPPSTDTPVEIAGPIEAERGATDRSVGARAPAAG